jgi:hypothetical protein
MVLPRLIRDQLTAATTKQFLADIVDVDFVGTSVAYVLSRGSDTVQRVVLDPARGPQLGAPQAAQIELNTTPTGAAGPCHTPTGIVISHAGSRAFVNCWVSRSLGVIDLAQQALIANPVAPRSRPTSATPSSGGGSSSPVAAAGPTAAGAAVGRATPMACPTTSPGASPPARGSRPRWTAAIATARARRSSGSSTGPASSTRCTTSSATPAACRAARAR